MRKPYWAGCFLFASALLCACQKHVAKTNPDRPPTPFKITLSAGGGFTGAVSGCTLGSDGQVASWDKRGAAPESILWSAVGESARILEFRRQMEKGGALEMNLRETGNMTTMVKLELPDTLLVWSWSGHGASESTPEPFRTWYPEVEAYCQSLSPAGRGLAAPPDPSLPKPDPEPDRK